MSHGHEERDALPDTDHFAELLREALTVIQCDQGSKAARCFRAHCSQVHLKKGENFCFSSLTIPSLSRRVSALSSYETVNKHLTGKAKRRLKGSSWCWEPLAFTAVLPSYRCSKAWFQSTILFVLLVNTALQVPSICRFQLQVAPVFLLPSVLVRPLPSDLLLAPE